MTEMEGKSTEEKRRREILPRSRRRRDKNNGLNLKSVFICLVIALILATTSVEGICVWQRGGGFRLACGFRQSGLFRLRSLGGLKGWAGAGFTIGDEDGFKDSLSNAETSKSGQKQTQPNQQQQLLLQQQQQQYLRQQQLQQQQQQQQLLQQQRQKQQQQQQPQQQQGLFGLFPQQNKNNQNIFNLANLLGQSSNVDTQKSVGTPEDLAAALQNLPLEELQRLSDQQKQLQKQQQVQEQINKDKMQKQLEEQKRVQQIQRQQKLKEQIAQRQSEQQQQQQVVQKQQQQLSKQTQLQQQLQQQQLHQQIQAQQQPGQQLPPIQTGMALTASQLETLGRTGLTKRSSKWRWPSLFSNSRRGQQQNHGPMQQGYAPMHQGPIPMQPGPMPMQGPGPMQQGRMPIQQGMPVQQQRPPPKGILKHRNPFKSNPPRQLPRPPPQNALQPAPGYPNIPPSQFFPQRQGVPYFNPGPPEQDPSMAQEFGPSGNPRPYGLKLLEGSENYGTKFTVQELPISVPELTEEELATAGYDTNIFPDIYFTTTTPKDKLRPTANSPPSQEEAEVDSTTAKSRRKKVRIIKSRGDRPSKKTKGSSGDSPSDELSEEPALISTTTSTTTQTTTTEATTSTTSTEPSTTARQPPKEYDPPGVSVEKQDSHPHRESLFKQFQEVEEDPPYFRHPSLNPNFNHRTNQRPSGAPEEDPLNLPAAFRATSAEQRERNLRILAMLGITTTTTTPRPPQIFPTKPEPQQLIPLIKSGYDPRYPPDHPVNLEKLRHLTSTTTTRKPFFTQSNFYDPQNHFSKVHPHPHPSKEPDFESQADTISAQAMLNKTRAYNERYLSHYNRNNVKEATENFWYPPSTTPDYPKKLVPETFGSNYWKSLDTPGTFSTTVSSTMGVQPSPPSPPETTSSRGFVGIYTKLDAESSELSRKTQKWGVGSNGSYGHASGDWDSGRFWKNENEFLNPIKSDRFGGPATDFVSSSFNSLPEATTLLTPVTETTVAWWRTTSTTPRPTTTERTTTEPTTRRTTTEATTKRTTTERATKRDTTERARRRETTTPAPRISTTENLPVYLINFSPTPAPAPVWRGSSREQKEGTTSTTTTERTKRKKKKHRHRIRYKVRPTPGTSTTTTTPPPLPPSYILTAPSANNNDYYSNYEYNTESSTSENSVIPETHPSVGPPRKFQEYPEDGEQENEVRKEETPENEENDQMNDETYDDPSVYNFRPNPNLHTFMPPSTSTLNKIVSRVNSVPDPTSETFLVLKPSHSLDPDEEIQDEVYVPKEPITLARDEEETGEDEGEKEEEQARPHPLKLGGMDIDTPSTYRPHTHFNLRRPLPSRDIQAEDEEQDETVQRNGQKVNSRDKSGSTPSESEEKRFREHSKMKKQPVPSSMFTAPEETEVSEGGYSTTAPPVRLPNLSLNPPPVPEVNEILMRPKDERGKKGTGVPKLSFQPPPPPQYQMYGPFQNPEGPKGSGFQGFLPPGQSRPSPQKVPLPQGVMPLPPGAVPMSRPQGNGQQLYNPGPRPQPQGPQGQHSGNQGQHSMNHGQPTMNHGPVSMHHGPPSMNNRQSSGHNGQPSMNNGHPSFYNGHGQIGQPPPQNSPSPKQHFHSAMQNNMGPSNPKPHPPMSHGPPPPPHPQPYSQSSGVKFTRIPFNPHQRNPGPTTLKPRKPYHGMNGMTLMNRPPSNNPNMIAPPPNNHDPHLHAPPKLIHMRPGNQLFTDLKYTRFPQHDPPPTPPPIITSERPLTEKESVLKALETLSKVNSDVIQSIVHEKLGVPKPVPTTAPPTTTTTLTTTTPTTTTPTTTPTTTTLTTTTTTTTSISPLIHQVASKLAPLLSQQPTMESNLLDAQKPNAVSLSTDAISSLFSPPSKKTVEPPKPMPKPTLEEQINEAIRRKQQQLQLQQQLNTFKPQPDPRPGQPSPELLKTLSEIATRLKTPGVLNANRTYTPSQIETMKKLITLSKLEEALKQGKAPNLSTLNRVQSGISNNWKPAPNTAPISNNVLLHKIDTGGATNSVINSNQLTPAASQAASNLLNAQHLSNFLKANNFNLSHFNRNSVQSMQNNNPQPQNVNSNAQLQNNIQLQKNAQLQNALANVPTLLALKALALQKAQNVRPTPDVVLPQQNMQRRGEPGSSSNSNNSPSAIDLSAILASPSPIMLKFPEHQSHNNWMPRSRLIDVKNAPKSFYPGDSILKFDENESLFTDFQCENQKYFPGLYADPNLSCKVFHLCAKTDSGYVRKTFRCPQETVFDQEVLRCNWNLYVDCSGAENKYHFNKYLSQSFQFLRILGEFSASYKPQNATFSG